jgi:lipopolysaccharide export system permease protein
VRIFEFDRVGVLLSLTQATTGAFSEDDEAWVLSGVQRDEFPAAAQVRENVKRLQMSSLRWPTGISAEMVYVALLKPDRMKTFDLFQYIRHLEQNAQSAHRYQIEFWKKVFYPISCLVMMVLALPFAYLHFRSGSIATFVFVGVLIGISFFLLNNVFGYVGNLQRWAPWLAAAAPGLIYSVLSLGAFGWLVLRR